jgi:hypothetical protein
MVLVVARADKSGGAMGREVGTTGAVAGTNSHAGERGISLVGVFEPFDVDGGPLLALGSREGSQSLLSLRPRRPYSPIESAWLLTCSV